MRTVFRWYLVVAIVIAVSAMTFAAAPVLYSKYKNVGDITVSVQLSDSLKTQDSINDLAMTDSGFVELMVTGVAALDPNDQLYIGFGADSLGTTVGTSEAALDTFTIKSPGHTGKDYVPFCFRYCTTALNTQTDSHYGYALYVAARGHGGSEAIQLYDVVFTATIKDDD